MAFLRLAVLNPGGRDRYRDFSAGPGGPEDPGHPPVNYHAYAAATRGAFYDRTEAVLAAGRAAHDAVLVLIRGKVEHSGKAVARLKQAGWPVLVTWKESGPAQIAAQLDRPGRVRAYQEILRLADGVVSPTRVLPPSCGAVPEEVFLDKTRFIPTPYPLEQAEWNFSIPEEKRRGIFVGTRQFFVGTRHHWQALSRCAGWAQSLDLPVTVINGDKRAGGAMLASLLPAFPKGALRVVEGPLRYADYLRLMSEHELVYQMDGSEVPGQVAGDAALCRMWCAGGNSALERLIYPASPEAAGDEAWVVSLLTDRKLREEALADARERAVRLVGYEAVAEQLACFVEERKAAMG